MGELAAPGDCLVLYRYRYLPLAGAPGRASSQRPAYTPLAVSWVPCTLKTMAYALILNKQRVGLMIDSDCSRVVSGWELTPEMCGSDRG